MKINLLCDLSKLRTSRRYSNLDQTLEAFSSQTN